MLNLERSQGVLNEKHTEIGEENLYEKEEDFMKKNLAKATALLLTAGMNGGHVS